MGGGTANVAVNIDADSEFDISASAAPTADVTTITNSGFSSATDGVDALQITYGVDDATGNVMNITPTFSHGDDVDSAETWTVIDVDAFTATNSIASTNQTAILHGLNFGDLTEAGTDLITSTGIEIGGGWDIGVAFSPGETITGDGTDLTIATGDRLLITTPNNGTDDVNITGSVTVTNDLAVTDDFSVEGIVDIGSVDTFTADDASPDVSGGVYFSNGDNTGEEIIESFDGGVAGQIIYVKVVTDAQGEITFDCDDSGGGANNLTCGTTDIVLDNNDHTSWIFDGTRWSLLGFVDTSVSNVAGADLAEYFPSDEDLNAGDIVSVDPTKSQYVIRSTGAYDSTLIGIVSTNPGITLGNPKEVNQIALVGRVPVNVTNENGSIQPGDYITSSSTPGYGMKATEAGAVVGIALESFDGATGQIIVKLVDGWYQPPVAEASNIQGDSVSAVEVGAEELVVSDAAFEGSITVKEHLYGSRDMAGRAKIVSGDDRVHVAFENEYEAQPIVTATLRSGVKIDGYWWVEEESTTGFDIRLDGSLSQDVEFNWIAVGVEGGVVSVSDGSEKDIEIYVKDSSIEEPVVEEVPVVEETVSEPVVEEDVTPSEAPVEESVPEVSSIEEPTV
ncbi:MAG: hypothetical protein UU31_C0001G0002 [Candidatus Uhrbacteria bacterium GW2011_GWA2_41_10]|nr:MAG: hypothetical protein UU31_C0001G0002 [Candidatus Uhrbacteria bacterium GW2011_GWA2_41_10]